MPVLLDSGPLGRRLFVTSPQARGSSVPSFQTDSASCIEIGLINNMPDMALEQTERQIITLLDAAAGDLVISLGLYAVPTIVRSEFGTKHLDRLHYRDAEELLRVRLDALIITGAEPQNFDLRQESYWPALTKVFDWADRNTFSTVLSCLAVHAAVLHFDGIERQPLDCKYFGVFDFDKASDNQLLCGTPCRLQVPHSRWNGIQESALKSCGYDILTKSPSEGVDMFVKSRNSLFVFFQGHPEYDAWTLLGEYRRDVGRFLSGERDQYPELPRQYFDELSAQLLGDFREQAINDRKKTLMSMFPTEQLAGKLIDTWRSTAINIYRNWLLQIVAKKASSMLE
jgi:homoserine O-succinyltransferase/O-acetyltransferase